MAKKKIKSSKSKKQSKENKYFYGALLTIAGILVIGIAAALLFGNTGTTTSGIAVSGTNTQNSAIQQEIDKTYADKWLELGVTGLKNDPQNTIVYIDQSKWAEFSVEEVKKRMDEAGDDFGKIIKKNGGNPKDIFVMFHDSVNRNIMIGTYSGASGAAIQQ